MSETQMVVREPGQLAQQSSHLDLMAGALSIQKVIEFRTLIENAMGRVMKEGQHYGKIPGTGDKPTLLQPGAQLLCTLFRLRPEYEIHEETPAPGHKRFRMTCRLVMLGNPPVLVAEGVGEASTMESKHRFRNAAATVEDTGEPVPPKFWSMSSEQGKEAAKKWLAEAFDGQPVGVKKVEGEWHVVKLIGGGDGKIENDNPADQWNTVLKMAKKRAFVDATITATSSSDFFTQDLEDMRENMKAIRTAAEHEEERPEGSGTARETAKPKEEKPHAGGWKTAVCHIGKKGGPIAGKTLGALDDGQRDWLWRTLDEKGDSRRSAADKKLYAALCLWKAESAKPKEKKGAEGGSGTPKDAEADGVNLEVLGQNLDWADIPNDLFMTVARREGWTKATEYGGISDAEATQMVDNLEGVTEKCREEMTLTQKGPGKTELDPMG